jgi:hypothetical protein
MGFLPFTRCRKLGICLAFISLLSVNTAFSAQPRKPSASRPTVKRPAPPKLSPIQLLAKQLTANSVLGEETPLQACGHSNFKGLLWALEGADDELNQDKDEFESTVDFEERQRRLSSAINTESGLIVCALPNEDLKFVYNADQELFELSFSSDLIIDSDVKRTGSYASSTRLGVKMIVTSYLSIQYRLDLRTAIGKKSPACMAASLYGPNKVYFSVPISTARQIKNSALIAFTGTAEPPFFQKNESTGSPTIDDPRDVYSIDMRLNFSPKSIVIYDTAGFVEISRCDF